MERSRIEKISKALADETRLRIFEAISAKAQMNCGEIVSLRGVTPATVSEHLKIFRGAGVDDCRRKGKIVLKPGPPGTIKAYANAATKNALRKKITASPMIVGFSR